MMIYSRSIRLAMIKVSPYFLSSLYEPNTTNLNFLYLVRHVLPKVSFSQLTSTKIIAQRSAVPAHFSRPLRNAKAQRGASVVTWPYPSHDLCTYSTHLPGNQPPHASHDGCQPLSWFFFTLEARVVSIYTRAGRGTFDLRSLHVCGKVRPKRANVEGRSRQQGLALTCMLQCSGVIV